MRLRDRRRLTGRATTGRDRGAVAVEMAIVMPMLLLLVAGIIDFGRMFMARQTITTAAREGARLDAIGSDLATVTIPRARDNARLGNQYDATSVFVTVTDSCSTRPASGRNIVTVRVQFNYIILDGIIRLFGPAGSIADGNIQAQGSMRCAG